MTTAYFVTGTDTNVGKTYIAAGLVRHFVAQGLRAVGMKPIASGCEMDATGNLRNEDALALQQASNVDADYALINPYSFAPAIAPHLAAAAVGVDIDIDIDKISAAYVQLCTQAEVVVVEGAGGFFVPLNATQTLADLAVALNLPVVLVVGIRLGCINHALLTVAAIEARGLKLAGWVANELEPEMPMFAENISSLQQRIAAPCLSVVRWQGAVVIEHGVLQ